MGLCPASVYMGRSLVVGDLPSEDACRRSRLCSARCSCDISAPDALRTFPGTYALVLRCIHGTKITVGALGPMQVVPGFYVYIGSAFGPGGLRSRLLHHLLKRASPHWHIDYLRLVTEPTEAWITLDPTKREHEWASALAKFPRVSVPIPRFGASDCRCPSHLFYADRLLSPKSLKRLLESHGASSGSVSRLTWSGMSPR